MDTELRDYERRLNRTGCKVKIVPLETLLELKTFLESESKRQLAILNFFTTRQGEQPLELVNRHAATARLTSIKKELTKILEILKDTDESI